MSDSERSKPAKAKIERQRWAVPVIWLVPVLAAAAVGYYFYDQHEKQGPTITVQFADVSGVKEGQTMLTHRGVTVGEVSDVALTSDAKHAVVTIKLQKTGEAFAKTGSRFWIVKAEITNGNIAGLGTVVSGPYIDAIPGNGAETREFVGLDDPPVTTEPGLHVVLQTDRLEHLQPDSPVYFRGMQVGTIEKIRMADDATHVNVHLLIRKPYATLLRTNSQFWMENAAEISGGVLSGLDVKVNSLRSLINGGVSFATPSDGHGHPAGQPAGENAVFVLHPEPDKDWLGWAPKFDLPPDTPAEEPATPKEKAPESILSGSRKKD